MIKRVGELAARKTVKSTSYRSSLRKPVETAVNIKMATVAFMAGQLKFIRYR